MLLDSEVTEKKFSVEEIRQLAAALGFPRNSLSKAIITKENEEDGISVKEFLKCCDERYFHQTLNFTFNLKSGAYNTQVLRRSIVLLANQLSFKQLEDVRVSYQMHEDYDQQGMRIEESTMIRTLKLCGLVVSPQKLMNRIRHLKATYKQKDRIQLYEFLDLLRWCELMSKQNLRYENVLSTKQSSHNVYMLDDFKEVITPRHKKILQILNERYQHQELLHEEPKLNSEKFTDHPIPPDTFEYQVKLANEDYANLQKKLKNTNQQVKLARGGFTNFRPATASACGQSVKHSSSETSEKIKVKMKMGTGSVSSACFTEVSGKSHATMPANFRANSVPPRPRRPASCPATTPQDPPRIKRLKFDIVTQNQRWADYFKEKISYLLPNYEDVMRRLVKEPVAPGVRRRGRRERPSKQFVLRLSQPKPMLPSRHVKHCEALSMGMGCDNHAVALQQHASDATKNVKVQKKRKKRRKKRDARTSFLTTFLSELDAAELSNSDNDVPEGYETQQGKSDRKKSSQSLFLDLLNTDCSDNVEGPLERKDSSTISNASVHCMEGTPAANPLFKKRDRVSEALDLICGDFARVYLDPVNNAKNQKNAKAEFAEVAPSVSDIKIEKLRERPSDTSRPLSARSSESQTTETTAFEQYISDPENLKISNKDSENGDSRKSKKLRKSYKRMVRRFEIS